MSVYPSIYTVVLSIRGECVSVEVAARSSVEAASRAEHANPGAQVQFAVVNTPGAIR